MKPIVGVVRQDGDVEFKQSNKTHVQLGLHRGRAWRYSPVTEVVYWHGDDSEHSGDDERKVSDFLESDGFKVRRHATLGEMEPDRYAEAFDAAHGRF